MGGCFRIRIQILNPHIHTFQELCSDTTISNHILRYDDVSEHRNCFGPPPSPSKTGLLYLQRRHSDTHLHRATCSLRRGSPRCRWWFVGRIDATLQSLMKLLVSTHRRLPGTCHAHCCILSWDFDSKYDRCFLASSWLACMSRAPSLNSKVLVLLWDLVLESKVYLSYLISVVVSVATSDREQPPISHLSW